VRFPRVGFFGKFQERGDRLMHLIRFHRILVPLLTLGLLACVLGCEGGTGGMGSTPPDPETSKKIAEETRSAMKSAQQERMKEKRAQGQRGGP
jgi:hypothetical protein